MHVVGRGKEFFVIGSAQSSVLVESQKKGICHVPHQRKKRNFLSHLSWRGCGRGKNDSREKEILRVPESKEIQRVIGEVWQRKGGKKGRGHIEEREKEIQGIYPLTGVLAKKCWRGKGLKNRWKRVRLTEERRFNLLSVSSGLKKGHLAGMERREKTKLESY